MRELYKTGLYSYNSIAKMYGVSKRCALIVINPKSAEKVKNRIKEHWRDYYNKNNHAEDMRKHRAYKKQLLEAGKIEIKK